MNNVKFIRSPVTHRCQISMLFRISMNSIVNHLLIGNIVK